MSENNEKEASQKTEEATQHKLDEAEKKGQVPLSKEVNHFFSFIAAVIVVGVLSPYVGMEVTRLSKPFLESSFAMMGDGTALTKTIFSTLWGVFLALAFPLLLFAAAGVAAGVLQTKFNASLDQIKPKMNRISIFSGIKRLFSIKAFVEFTKSLLKLLVVGSITIAVIWPELTHIDALAFIPVPEIFHEVRHMITHLFIAVLCALFILAAGDFLFQKFQFLKEMRMTKEEVKEEHKKMEGSPEIKSERRRKQMEMASKRSVQEIPHATVLVTNPTHYAVALKWNEESMDSPLVVAKGADLVALHMRRIAKEHEVPIVENPPLARAMHANLEIDDTIKPEHYKAVAEIIRYVTGVDRRYLARESIS